MARFTQKTMDNFSKTIEASQERSYARRDEIARRRHERRQSVKRVIRNIALLAGGAAATVVSGPRIVAEVHDTLTTSQAEVYERTMERCVSTLVGREVDLVREESGPGLQYPRSVIAEQRACERNGGDPNIAQHDIHPVPLASLEN